MLGRHARSYSPLFREPPFGIRCPHAAGLSQVWIRGATRVSDRCQMSFAARTSVKSDVAPDGVG